MEIERSFPEILWGSSFLQTKDREAPSAGSYVSQDNAICGILQQMLGAENAAKQREVLAVKSDDSHETSVSALEDAEWCGAVVAPAGAWSVLSGVGVRGEEVRHEDEVAIDHCDVDVPPLAVRHP